VNAAVSGLIGITSDITAAEAYDEDVNVRDVTLGIRNDNGVAETGVFELYQNSPNPFAKESEIRFRLPEAGLAKLSIYNVTGKVIRVFDLQGSKGMNTIKLQKSDLGVSGVLYYQLDANNHSATKRMVIIE